MMTRATTQLDPYPDDHDGDDCEFVEVCVDSNVGARASLGRDFNGICKCCIRPMLQYVRMSAEF